MGKLGKKARKFAKKNLQSVLKKNRKNKALLKKRYSSKDKKSNVENKVEDPTKDLNRRDADGVVIKDTSLDAVFTDSDVEADTSDTDGYLSEDASISYVTESEPVNDFEDNGNTSTTLLTKNKMIEEELVIQKKKLDKLKKKDPEFAKFLRSYRKSELSHTEEMCSDEDEEGKPLMHLVDEDESTPSRGKILTTSLINSWFQRVTEEQNESAFISLLNAYRDACHFGTESTGRSDNAPLYIIQTTVTFCNVITFVLQEADTIFRGLLTISSSACNKEAILELKNTSKWKQLKPLVKSYLRSTLFLLRQVTDSDILAKSLTRLRASIIFFAAFPSLLQRLIKISVHLWTTGGGDLSSCSFLIVRDVAVVFSPSCFDTCLTKTYKAYIARCKVIEAVDFPHIEFLKSSFVELCSLDVEKSSSKALVSIQQLAKILQQGLQTKRKEAIESICSWQYANCIDIWVLFISANAHDYGLQNLLYTTTQLVNGVAHLFPGPRYFPFRLKCIQWLNRLSISSGIFIPVSSFVLDVLEYDTGKDGVSGRKSINFSSSLKLAKHWLKSQKFQEECVHSALELLTLHFAQWTHHISFPDLATIPLIRLRRFYDITTVESRRNAVKRLIDMVEQNVEFVQKKRDEVAFSPKDQQNAESFPQLEKESLNTPFAQYYRSVIDKAASRNLQINRKISKIKLKNLQKGKVPNDTTDAVPGDSEKRLISKGDGTVNSKNKKRRVSKI